MKIIGLSGHAKSGKSTVAKYISSYLHTKNIKTKELAFATPLKEICKILYNLSDDDLNIQSKKEQIIPYLGVSPRTILQKFGTEIGRDILPLVIKTNIKESIWIWNLNQQILMDQNINYIVSDVRFQDEQNLIKKYNGISIKIVRDNNVNMNHPSESEQDNMKFDYIILNNDSLEELYYKIRIILDNLK